ncbi:hypothetical protein VNO78_30460 [Psophocarpus tetragonolobus]|uniref:Uncharacterized protein n=1 Tax=Psophocarpus tetragonolobus TaxID=3891 RepID=A0AAN9RXX3_PSOTE
MICTSVSLRASTRVSSGFAPLKHSSPYFGSRQVCSHSNPSQKIGVGRRCTHGRIPPISFLPPYGFTRPLTRTHVRLLGPCFKTGRMGSPQAIARSMHVPRHAQGRTAIHNRDDDVSASISIAQAWATITIHVGLCPESIGGPALTVPHPTGAHRWPPSASFPTIASTL